MYVLGGRSFTSQEQIKAFVQNLLRTQVDLPWRIPDEYTPFLVDLVARHPRAAEKFGVGAVHFMLVAGPYRSRRIHLIRTDGTWTDFSYKKCIAGGNMHGDVVKAMRDAVNDQCLRVRQEGPESFICPFTQQLVWKQEAHVDHAPPNTFAVLMDRFLKMENFRLEDIRTLGMQRWLESDDRCARWQAFHAANATLRLVSAEANTRIIPRLTARAVGE